jgi:hypothetical protein
MATMGTCQPHRRPPLLQLVRPLPATDRGPRTHAAKLEITRIECERGPSTINSHAPLVPSALAADGGVRVHWSMTYHCSYGQHVALVGDGPQLGAWEPDKAVALEWTDGDQWQTELSLVPG